MSHSKPTWQDLQIFTAEGTDLAVRVQCSDGHRPQYSFAIGRMREGRFVSFLRPQVATEHGTVNLTPFPLEALGRLIAQAEQLICGNLQRREDDFLLRRKDRGQRDAKKSRSYSDENDDAGWK